MANVYSRNYECPQTPKHKADSFVYLDIADHRHGLRFDLGVEGHHGGELRDLPDGVLAEGFVVDHAQHLAELAHHSGGAAAVLRTAPQRTAH